MTAEVIRVRVGEIADVLLLSHRCRQLADLVQVSDMARVQWVTAVSGVARALVDAGGGEVTLVVDGAVLWARLRGPPVQERLQAVRQLVQHTSSDPPALGVATGRMLNDASLGKLAVELARLPADASPDLELHHQNTRLVEALRARQARENELLVARAEEAELRETLQNQARELERSNQALASFAAAAGHDLKEPLTVIEMYATVLERRLASDPDALELLGVMRQASERTRAMLAGLLDYAKAGGGAREAVDAGAAAREAVANLHAAIEAASGRVEVGPLPMVLAQPTPLVRVIQNLVSNAIKYRSDEPPRVHITARPAGEGRVALEVRDNGRGIPEASRVRVLELFAQLDGEAEGHGVGLALVNRLVTGFGGSLDLQGNDEGGTTAVVELDAG